jgi:hypothetical protein
MALVFCLNWRSLQPLYLIYEVAAGPFHHLDMWPMTNVLMWNQLLVDHLCQAKSVLRPDPLKSLEMPNQSEHEMKQLAAIAPHLLLLDHSIILVCDQWQMFWCETSSWRTICAKPSQFLGQIWSKVWKHPTSLKQFAAITPHLMLLDHSIILVCDQWVMFCCETSSWWSTICAKPSQF